MPTTLIPDSPAPALSLPLVGGGTWDLGAQTPDTFTMVVFYRGLHCPVCKGYLTGLQHMLADYEAAGFSVVVASMNTPELAEKTVADWGIDKLTVAHSLSEETARAWGLYLSRGINEVEAEIFSEPGVFWIRPDGRLYLADVSNMPWGRPDLGFLLSKVALIKERNYPARGTY